MKNLLELYIKSNKFAKIGVWEYNLVTEQIYWDDMMREIHEVSEEFDANSASNYQFYASIQDEELLKKNISKLLKSGKPYDVKYQIKTFEGNLKWIQAHGLAEFENGNCIKIYGTAQDITESIKLQEEAHIREQQFSNAVKYSPIGMALVSIEGSFLRVNKSLCKILGYTEEEMLELKFHDITYHDDLSPSLDFLNKIINSEVDAYHIEKRYIHKDGHLIWVLISVSLVRDNDKQPSFFISQIKDIHESKRILEELEKERHRLSEIIEGTKVGTWEVDFPSGEFIVNKRMAKMLGYSMEEFTSRKISFFDEITHPEDLMVLKKLLNNCFNKTINFLNFQYRVHHKKGYWLWIHSKGKVIKWSKDGDPITMIGTITDISALKNKESILKRNLEIIEKQNKKLLNFAYIVSHNLRSHAGNFQMLLDILTIEEDENEKEEMMRLLVKNAKNLQETVDNLNEVVQIQTNINQQIAHINIYHQIKNILNSITTKSQKEKMNINIDVPEDLEIAYNPAYLESILLNLLTNAIKYRHAERPLQIDISTSLIDKNILLEVKDNGIGIDLKRHEDKLFGMYKTFHTNKDARGIGLFITKNQVEAMGGKIFVDSELGKWTSFKVQF